MGGLFSDKGGSQTTEIKIPKLLEDEARTNINIANELSAIGPLLNRGPTVAALSPQQIASMQATDLAAQAFGMPSAGSNMFPPAPESLGIMPHNATTDTGVAGYSGFDQGQTLFGLLGPAQQAMINSFSMNPNTAAAPANPNVPNPDYVPSLGELIGYGAQGEPNNDPALADRLERQRRKVQRLRGRLQNAETPAAKERLRGKILEAREARDRTKAQVDGVLNIVDERPETTNFHKATRLLSNREQAQRRRVQNANAAAAPAAEEYDPYEDPSNQMGGRL